MHETFVARLLDGADVEMASAKAPATRDEYAQRSTSGGMPVALRRPPGRSRSRWFSNYVNLLIDRDVLDISRVRQREMLPRLLRQLAARSGQVLNMAAISGTIGLEKSMTENYIKLLESVFLVYRPPAWGTTLGNRWVILPAGSFAGFPFTNAKAFIRLLKSGGFDSLGKDRAVGVKTTVNGQPAIRFSAKGEALYIATTGQPYPLEIRQGSGNALYFRYSGLPASITAPSHPLDLSKLAG